MDHVRAWRVAALDGTELLDARLRTHSFPPHSHAEYVIGSVTAGAVRFSCRGRHWHARAGDVLLINPEDVHTGRPAPYVSYLVLYPHPEILRCAPVFPRPVARDAAAHRAIVDLHRSAVSDAGHSTVRRRLDELVTALAPHAAGDSPTRALREPPVIGAARAFLDAHVAEPVLLERLCELTGLSGPYLNRLFARHVGAPPHGYQLAQRVRLVRRLLADGCSPARAAAEAGYVDQSHMTRHFKRHVGMTPARYARTVAGA